MKKLILIAAVAAVSVLASCASKTNCVCTDKDGKEIVNVDYSSLSSSQRETTCNTASTVYTLTGGKCELK